MARTRTTPVKYHVVVPHVREVTLLGRADLSYWTERLRAAGLHAARAGGFAQLLLSAADARFKGIRFREVSVSVFVSREAGGATRDGAYLVQAFNSVRFFAFVERTFFGTPYHPATIEIESNVPAAIDVRTRPGRVLRAEMSSEVVRQPSRNDEENWVGPIFLPARTAGGPSETLFHAKIGGLTSAYPFQPGRDRVSLVPTDGAPVIRMLLDSGFTGEEWIVRGDATHGKGRTVRRASAGAF